MQKDLLSKISKMLVLKNRHKNFLKVVSALMAVVVFCTTYALILPALTLSKETYCGLEEHTHTEECLAVPTVTEAFVCRQDADYVLHTHDDNCYYRGELICTLPEYTAHTHTEDCYAQVRELTCGLTERAEEHYHNEDCFIHLETLVCDKEESEGHSHSEDCYDENGGLICGLEETGGHTHTEDCYVVADEQICGKTEGTAHSHTEDCYTVVDKLKCNESELIPHTHDESCYVDGVVTCGMPQVVYHQHDQSCMGEKLVNLADIDEDIYTCDPAEGADFVIHTHDENCYNSLGALVCTLDERSLHSHDESCYNESGSLKCTVPEVALHTHDDDCLVDGVISCDLPVVIEHQHDESCIDAEAMERSAQDKYSCGMVEHTHTDECYEKPDGLQFDFTVEDEGVSGTITIDWSDELPDDLACTVVVMQGYEDDYDAMYQAASDSIELEDGQMNEIKLYQIEWSSNGEDYTLPEGLNPTIELNVEKSDDLGEVEQITGVVISPNTETETESEAVAEEQAEPAAASLDDEEYMAEDIAEEAETSVVYASSVSSYSAAAAAAYVAEDEDSEADELTTVTSTAGAYSTTAQDADESGVMTMSLSSNTVAVAKTIKFNSSGSVGYYKLVNTESELTSGGQYVLIFENGNMMMASNVHDKHYHYSDRTYDYAKFNSPLLVTTHEVSDASGNKYFTFVDNNGKFVKYDTSSGYAGYHWRIEQASVSAYGTLYCTSQYYPTAVKNDEFQAGGTNPSNIYFVYNLISGNNNEHPLWLGQDDVTSTNVKWGGGINIMWNSLFRAWHIGANTYESSYYYMLGGEFTGESDSVITQHLYGKDSSGNATTTAESNKHMNNVLIYKYVGTSISTFDDEIAAGSKEDVVYVKDENPNTYENDVSSITDTGLTGTDSDNRTELASSVLQYASDPATSLIQEEYSFLDQNPSTMDEDELLALQQKNDGRVVTDKSVIYRKDDYGAFDEDDYGQGDFSVTLSAIGQEWNVREELDSTVPVDVMFVLDVSGSMTEDYENEEKWVSSVKALNSIAKEIVDRNPDNRVGLVAFSNTAYEILPMAHWSYSEADDAIGMPFLTYGSYQYTATDSIGVERTGWARYLAVSDGVVDNVTGATVTNRDMKYDKWNSNAVGFGLWGDTFTQRGLEQAYNTMSKVTDTTAVINVYDDNGNVTKKTVNRQPVIVLLSDGDPTSASTYYMDPSNGSTFGIGQDASLFGYYTVLSANYFKNMVGIKYNKVADMYTIGLGIDPDKATTDYNKDLAIYSLAVLNPTEENISKISSSSFFADFKWLLSANGQSGTNGYSLRYNDRHFSGDTEYVVYGLGYWPTDQMTARDSMNPYTNYSYADGAYYGDMTAEELEDIFEKILNQVQSSLTYNFMLEPDTYVTFTDEIGDGMTVKGDPVLRLNGENVDNANRVKSDVKYTEDGRPYTEYYWTGTVKHLNNTTGNTIDVSLSGIKVRVYQAYESADGSVSYPNETVEFSIPERLLPVYYPNKAQEFYYEADPVRLIYMVGLSDDELESIENDTGEIKNRVYYTSQYDENSYESSTTVTFTPAVTDPKTGQAISSATTGEIMVNPYYTDANMASSAVTVKTDNTTETAVYSFYEDMTSVANSSAKNVTQYLGNNGKLTLNRPEVSNVRVNKEWSTSGVEADSVTVRLYASGTMQKTGSTEVTNGVWCLGEKTLSASDKDSENWTALWNALPESEVIGDYTYTYKDFYIREAAVTEKRIDILNKYDVSYKDADGKAITVTTLSLTEPTAEFKKAHPVLDKDTTVSAALANGGEVTILNSVGYSLPYTGGIGAEPYCIAGVMLIMLSATTALFCKSKRKEEM